MKTEKSLKWIISNTMVFLLFLVVFIFLFTSCGSSDKTSGEITVNNVFGDFESTDMDGNPVDKSAFADKSLTMVNIWGTFCNPCIDEMPDLGDISREYANKDFQVIGIPVDVATSSGAIVDYKVETAKEIISSTKADYLHILPSQDLMNVKLSKVDAVPETIFVDENGNQIGESYLGSKSKEEWMAIIDDLLSNCASGRT